jgi:hypothetical protein
MQARTPEQIQADYLKFRGKCKELSEQAVKEDPTLRLVRGHYFCAVWNSNEPHWWTVREDGTVYDPSKAQFPCNGMGIYEEFDGIVPCAECGKEVEEKDAKLTGNYGFCSNACAMRFVGL